MGAYNTIKTELSCPFCDHRQEWTVQFKYGNCWQFEYHPGDRLRWGGNKKGRQVGGNLRTSGIVEEKCKGCFRDFINAVVYISDNVIQRVELSQQSLTLIENYERVESE
jgi:hypothetical protein